MLKKFLSSTLAFTLFIGGIAAFAEIEDDHLRAAAAQGDASAQFKLADEYFYGENGRKRDYTIAVLWYRRAAMQGMVEAIFNYGVCLDGGLGIKRDPFAAADKYKEAAEKGFHPAMFNHALILMKGPTLRPGDEKNPRFNEASRRSVDEGKAILEKLVEEDFNPARIELASYYISMRDKMPERLDKAYKLLTEAEKVEGVSPKVYRLLADCCYGGLGTDADPERMIACLQKGSDAGDVEAMAKLAFCYKRGIGTEPSDGKAIELFRKAAESGHAMAQYEYSLCLAENNPNGEEQLFWLKKSAENSCPQALYRLGKMSCAGQGGMKQNGTEGAKYYFEASKLGYPPAQYELACFYLVGENVTIDQEAAVYWFRRSAEGGNAAAMRRLAVCLFHGNGCTKSLEDGEEWLTKAANGGDVIAQRMIAEGKLSEW